MSADRELYKIGQPVHLLQVDGKCAFGFITDWNDDQQLAVVMAFPHLPEAGGLRSMLAHSANVPHDPACQTVPGAADPENDPAPATWHLAGECVWGR